MSKRNDCFARQYSDQMICSACGLIWDLNDPEPPACGKIDKRTKKIKKLKVLEPITGSLKLPETLPIELATEMVKTFSVYAQLDTPVIGMQAAYRLLLDRIEQ
jgi:hypothetical protein